MTLYYCINIFFPHFEINSIVAKLVGQPANQHSPLVSSNPILFTSDQLGCSLEATSARVKCWSLVTAITSRVKIASTLFEILFMVVCKIHGTLKFLANHETRKNKK